ncbi:poly(ADP-ribose) glycohydrolase-like [Tubulanus polymorphus]|uniref:poly(ADP-ribose) glycohydrolase-like n=1 Tax=Tubulanus polymorphus TaxID=672921 RepID=UPI003DA4902C
MSELPPRKRLKQSDISSFFSSTSSKNTDTSSDKTKPSTATSSNTAISGTVTSSNTAISRTVKRVENHSHLEVRTENVKHQTLENTMDDDMDPKMREKLAAAAENRALTRKSSSAVESTSKDQAPSLLKQDSADSYGECSQTLDNSAPLFSDSEELTESQDSFTSANVNLDAGEDTGKGFPLQEMNSIPDCSLPLPALKSNPNHTVLINTNYDSPSKNVPFPYPRVYTDVWDANHVRMPCSKENLYPVELVPGQKELQQRWDVIRKALTAEHTSSYDIEESILSYNTRYENKWNFAGLHSFFNEVLTDIESKEIFENVLPGMMALTLKLPELCTQGIPLLRAGSSHSITFSQQQIACLLANAFFCTFPRRNSKQKQSEYSNFPDINFTGLFQAGRNGPSTRTIEKLKCIFHYFKRVVSNMPTGNVTFTRRILKNSPQWNSSTAKLHRLYVSASGTIEDDGHGLLQADFANRFIGGGVLRQGLVQEEIRFMICPEMIVSRLFTEALLANEVLLMTGCERFSNYKGYSDSFIWDGNYVDSTPRDSWKRRCTDVLAIDALVVRQFSQQFRPSYVNRELTKAFSGFVNSGVAAKHLSAIATGNWGCGAFGGDKRLKGLIQLMAAAEAKRDVAYFTFADSQFSTQLYEMHKFAVEHDLTVGDLWAQIQQYNQNVCSKLKGREKPVKNLYEYIYDGVLGLDSEESEENSNQGSEDWRENTP